MRVFLIFVCMIAAMLTWRVAQADTQVELLDTWPAGDTVTLHRNQNFYLHLRYGSDKPVHIWARPYFDGTPVKAGSNPSRIYPAGGGEALGWFFLFDPGAQVDEIRIMAGDGTLNDTPVVATFPVAVTRDDEPAGVAPQPAWLASLRAADETASRADDRKAMNTPPSPGDGAIIGGFVLAFVVLGLLGVAGPWWGLLRWRGGWRMAAAIPAAVMAFVVLRIVVDGLRDPTSHNLWPFEIIMWGALSCAWMLVAGLAHKFSGAGRKS